MVQQHRDWLVPNHYEEASDSLKLSVHSWLLTVGGKRILIDTCVGNHKPRPHRPKWHLMETKYLERLKAAGVEPDQIDMVMCTHLHVDHVGWNTRLENGKLGADLQERQVRLQPHRLRPLPEARQRSARPGRSMAARSATSVLPVVEAGLTQMVEGAAQLDENLKVEPAPGHTPGTIAIKFESKGEKGAVLRRHPASRAAGLSPGVEQLRLRRGQSARARAGARRSSIAPARARG